MPLQSFKILSYNVGGLGCSDNHVKFSKLLNRFVYPYHACSPDIICFQEVKLNLATINKVYHSLPHYNVYHALDPGNSAESKLAKAGIIIAIKKSLNIRVLDRRYHSGWCLSLKCRMNDKVFILSSVYLSPSDSTVKLDLDLATLESDLKHFHCDNILLTGDFNCTFLDLDVFSRQQPAHHKRRAKILTPFLENWQLQDIWRIQNPYSRKFTHRSNGSTSNISCRLDYIFCSLNFTCNVSDCLIGVSYCSDHSPIYLDILFNEEPCKPKSFRFPVDLCYSDQFRLDLCANIEQIKADNPDVDADIHWELIKSTIPSTAIRFKGLKSRIRKEMVENYEVKIAQLSYKRDLEDSPLLRVDFNKRIYELNANLDALFQEGKALKYASNLARWYSENHKNSKYFLNKFKEDRDHPVISQLITNNGTITNNQEILKEAHAFYSDLYRDRPSILPEEDLDNAPSLSNYHLEVLSNDITQEELLSALKKMKQSSAPGSDGLTVKFYIHFWNVIKDDLLDCYKFCFQAGRMSTSQRQGLIKLIPKKLRNLLLITNWRPITLLNVDYKILTKLFASRLRDILPDLIGPDQRGFVKDRRLSNGILDLYAIIDLVIHQEDDFLLCTIDIQKAFDSINWKFLKYVFNLFGFPDVFTS